MPPKKKVNVSKLKGVRLYNFLLKELGEQNAKYPQKQRLGIDSRRKIVKEQLYPKYKEAARVGIRAIRADIRAIVNALPPQEICNPVYLPASYLRFIEYYELDNHIRNQLPDCIDVKVNAGTLGVTRVFNTANYSYYGSGVRAIIEQIRNLIQNESGEAYFDGIVRLKPRKLNNGRAENYFIEYILYINDTTESDEIPVSYSLPSSETETIRDIKAYMSRKFKELQREKAKRKRIAKKKKPKTEKEKKQQVTQSVRKAIQSYKELLKQKVISKKQFDTLRATLLNIKNKKKAIEKRAAKPSMTIRKKKP